MCKIPWIDQQFLRNRAITMVALSQEIDKCITEQNNNLWEIISLRINQIIKIWQNWWTPVLLSNTLQNLKTPRLSWMINLIPIDLPKSQGGLRSLKSPSWSKIWWNQQKNRSKYRSHKWMCQKMWGNTQSWSKRLRKNCEMKREFTKRN